MNSLFLFLLLLGVWQEPKQCHLMLAIFTNTPDARRPGARTAESLT